MTDGCKAETCCMHEASSALNICRPAGAIPRGGTLAGVRRAESRTDHLTPVTDTALFPKMCAVIKA